MGHPRREELFMPDGQLLRRIGGDLEAIEPVGGLFGSHKRLQPKRMFEALKNLQNHKILLGALDLLLQVDPKERPSAAEAPKTEEVRRLEVLEAQLKTRAPSPGKRHVGFFKDSGGSVSSEKDEPSPVTMRPSRK
eukprot:symbB.v1.2.034735.t1/scaffold4534.1/size38374/3